MYTLAQIASRIGGQISGDSAIRIEGVRPFETARAGDITLAASPAYRHRLSETAASAVIVPPGVESGEKNLLVSNNPKAAFARVLQLFHQPPFQATGVSGHAVVGSDCRLSDEIAIHPFARVGDGVEIGRRVTIGSGASIGDGCRIGDDCFLHPNCTLYPGVKLGDRVVVHAGAVLGADGFGYVRDGADQVKIPQIGGVEIHDDVEIGANSCVDRATFGVTVLERGVKLDNHVHVGHNCRVGENTVIVGCVGISGSVVIGKDCVLAGQSGVVDHVRIGDGVTVMMKTAVSRDVPAGSTISGPFGRDHRKQLRIEAVVRRLPEIYQEWRQMKSQLKGLLEKRGD